ncbi:MAG TPA: FixH family protein [Burkholderiaceae bacterium]|nr:FixH family protein [Burkholderiaceae bacterium]
MSRALTIAACLCIGAGSGHASDDCGALLKAAGALRAEGEGYTVAFVPQPSPLASGRHFALDIAVCPGPGVALPKGLQVDADMPAHKHGMNYRASVAARGPGLYHAEGLMLHMPGRWRFIFDLALDGRSARLTHEVDVP